MTLVTTLVSILAANLIFSFLLSLVVYIRSQKYYRPLIKQDKDGNPINLHEVYDPFHPHDKVNFITLWIGAFFCAFIKMIFSLFIVIFVNWHIQILYCIHKNSDTNQQHWQKLKGAISFWSSFFLIMNGVNVKMKEVHCEETYKKYLGENYDFSDQKYSLITSNHIGFFEIVICMYLYSSGFMAKTSVANYWFVGPISMGLHCLYVDRDSEEGKKNIFNLLLERQQNFYEGKYLPPLVLFPEGTVSCGRDILRFKKGAFYSLLPIKPQIVSYDKDQNYHMSVGASNVILFYFKNLCHFVNNMYISQLPVIRPTDFMYEKYKDLGKEKWEIYANVVRKIYSEVGNLKEVNFGFRDLRRYIKAMRTGVYDPNENMDYEGESKKEKEKSDENDIKTGNNDDNKNDDVKLDVNENENKKEEEMKDKEEKDNKDVKDIDKNDLEEKLVDK